MIHGESTGHKDIVDVYTAPAYPMEGGQNPLPLEGDGHFVVTKETMGVQPPTINSENWQTYMRCLIRKEVAGIDLLSDDKSEQKQAIQFCGGCIVQPECLLQDTKDDRPAAGIVAGLTMKQRKDLSKPEKADDKKTIVAKLTNDREILLRTRHDGYWLEVSS